jgi:hypothetical protein
MTRFQHTNSPNALAAASGATVARRFRRACADARGQALVEFALVLPVLILLVFGITQFALALNSANDETHLANEVARFAAVNEDPGGGTETLARWGKQQLLGQHTTKPTLSNQTVCISFPENKTTKTKEQIGDPVEVVVKGEKEWLPMLTKSRKWFPWSKIGSITVEGKAVMRLEAAPTVYGKECV